MICHAGLSLKQHVWVAMVIMYQILSIWALLADSLSWRHHDAAKICLLVTGVTNIALATVGVVYVTKILAQRPAGFCAQFARPCHTASTEACKCPAIDKADSKEHVLCSALCRFVHK